MDLYVILGVERSASGSELKRAYRRLARKYHPDINPGDRETEAVFRRVSEAYETLIDPERRQDYDHHGLSAARPAEGGIAFEGFDFSGASAGEPASSFGDLFAEVIAESGRRRPQEASTVDLHATLQVTFEQAMRGGTH
jgi:molecular chaperone DnaJ